MTNNINLTNTNQTTTSNDLQDRIRRNAQAKRIVIMSRNGQLGVASYDPMAQNKESQKVDALPAGYDGPTATMAMAVKAIENAVKNGNDGQKVDIYLPAENAIRIRSLFSRMKNGEAESLSEEDIAHIVEFRGDEMAQKYISAVDAAYKALQEAKAQGKYVQVHTLDDISFTRLPEDVAKNWKLSGVTVSFSNGKGVIPAGTKMSDGKLTTAPIVINGAYIAGRRTMGVRPINGNQAKKELVALKDAKFSRDVKILQGMRLALLTAMPAEKSSFELAFEEAAAARQSA